MKNKLMFTVLLGIVATIIAPSQSVRANVLPKVDIQGDFASFHDVVSGMKGESSFNTEMNSYHFSVNEKEFELKPSTGYAMVDGVNEPYRLKASESDETVMNIVRVSPILFEEELFVPIEFIEKFLNLTFEDGNFKSDDEIIFEGEEEVVTPPSEDVVETPEQPEESDKVEDSEEPEIETDKDVVEEEVEQPEEKPVVKPEPKPETPVQKPENNTGNNNGGNTSTGGNQSTTKPNVDPVVVKSISVDRTSITLQVGGTGKIVASVSPSNVPDTSMTYASSNDSVVTSDKNGNLKAVGVGTATITVISNYTPTVRTTVTVTVNPVSVTSISLNKGNTTLEVGGTLAISATVSPSNATSKGVKWTSSNTSVATVDSHGNVKAIAAGTATITATSTSNSSVKASLTITVNAPKKLTFTGDSLLNKVGNFDGWWIDTAAYWGPYGTWNEFNIEVNAWNGRFSAIPTLDVLIYVYGHNVHPEETSEQLKKALSQIIPSGASTIASKVKANAKGNETYEFDGRKVVVSYGGLTEIEIHGKK